MNRCLSALVLSLACVGVAVAGNWPAFRGPDNNGVSPEKDVPLKWSRTENVKWKTPLPEAGHSSPVVWGDRVFLTQALDKGKRRALLCLDRADGKILWQKEVEYTGKEPVHKDSTYCAATPVTDGERVIVSHGSAGMFCYDFAGKELWRKDLGKQIHIWGNASSPILYGDLAILWCGPGERQFLIAVSKKDGSTVWQHDEPGGRGDQGRPYVGSWSTPIVVKVGDHDELLLGVPENLKGFDPKSGKELWACAGLHNGDKDQLVYTSPVYADGIAVAFAGFGGAALAARVGGKGDVTETNRLWYQPSGPQRIGSPVLLGEHVYLVNENGTAECLELKTGKDVWGKKRVCGTVWGSLVTAGGRLYITDQKGDTAVLAASPEFKELAKNSLDETSMSTPAVADREIFLRTHNHLWCIAEKK